MCFTFYMALTSLSYPALHVFWGRIENVKYMLVPLYTPPHVFTIHHNVSSVLLIVEEKQTDHSMPFCTQVRLSCDLPFLRDWS